MVEAAQDGHGQDRSIPDSSGQSSGKRIRDVLLEPLMGACSVEGGHIGLEHSGELLLVEDEQVIEALPAYAPQKALAVGVGARSVIRCLENLYV